MALDYFAPGVYVEEVDRGSRPIEGISMSVAGFVGFTEDVRGDADLFKPLLITKRTLADPVPMASLILMRICPLPFRAGFKMAAVGVGSSALAQNCLELRLQKQRKPRPVC